MASLWEDTRLVLRQFRLDMSFVLKIVTCLSLGLGSVAGVYSVLHHVLIDPLPFHEADRLVMVRSVNLASGRLSEHASLQDFLDWKSQATCFESLAAYRMARLDIPHENGFHRIFGFFVSDDFLEVLRSRPHLGSTLDTGPHELNQIMLGTNFWNRRFQSDPTIVGKVIEVNSWATWPKTGSRGYTLTGLLPDGLTCLPCQSWFSNSGLNIESELDFCLPMDINSPSDRTWREVEVVGRLKQGVSLHQAQSEMDLIAARLQAYYPIANGDWTVRLVPLKKHIFANVDAFVFAMFGGAILILAIGNGNASILLFSRFTQRQTDLAVQIALGATPNRLFRQLLVEAALLVLSSSLAGIMMTRYLLAYLTFLAPRNIPRLANVQIGFTTIATLVGFSLFAMLVICVVPVTRLITTDLNRFLNAAGRTSTTDRTSTRTTRWLLVCGISVSCVLLVGAGSFFLNLLKLRKSDLGFEVENRLTMAISLPQAKHEWNQNSLYCHEILRKVRKLPGIVDASAIKGLPMAGKSFDCRIVAEGRPDLRPEDLPTGVIRVVTDNYFQTMGIALLRGRHFTDTDSVGEVGHNRTVLVNQTLAKSCWPDVDPIGRRVKAYQGGPWMEIVGVVADVRNSKQEPESSDLYFPEKLFPQPLVVLIVQTEVDPLSFAGPIREIILSVDRDTHITNTASLEQLIVDSHAYENYTFVLISVLAICGSLLSFGGVLLVSAYFVEDRYREIAIRVACGATPWMISKMLLGQIGPWILCAVVVSLGILAAIPTYSVMLWHRPILMMLPACLVIAALLATAFVGGCAARFIRLD